MKKLLAAVAMLAFLASPALAAKKHPKQPHPKYNYSYHAPKMKFKAPKPQKHHSHSHNVRQQKAA
jgi:hypothetical protein